MDYSLFEEFFFNIDDRLVELADIEKRLVLNDFDFESEEYRVASQRHSELLKVRGLWEDFVYVKNALKDNMEIVVAEGDLDMRVLVKEDRDYLESVLERMRIRLARFMNLKNDDDDKSVVMELRAGIGGDESALFVKDCVRMYKMYADSKGWKYDELIASIDDLGGYKEYVMSIHGKNVHKLLQCEGGVHRVQRIPETESQGRIHTSAISIAVIQEVENVNDVNINDKDLRIDTFRSSGAGGQHVNTTDSAVRITHIPTGISVSSQQEKSQHKNREIAMKLLVSKLQDLEREKIDEEHNCNRREQFGSGDRSDKIRTYNYPQNRIVDHRASICVYNLKDVMNGKMDGLVMPVVRELTGRIDI